jgi:hypothetical protein
MAAMPAGKRTFCSIHFGCAWRFAVNCNVAPPAAPANTVARLIAGYQVKPKQIHNRCNLLGVKLKENKCDQRHKKKCDKELSHGSLYCKLIPSPIDQNPCAHWRNPMDMMRHG